MVRGLLRRQAERSALTLASSRSILQSVAIRNGTTQQKQGYSSSWNRSAVGLVHNWGCQLQLPSASNSQQCRTYLFVPTSWKELELQWLPRNDVKERIVQVHLFRQNRPQNKHDNNSDDSKTTARGLVWERCRPDTFKTFQTTASTTLPVASRVNDKPSFHRYRPPLPQSSSATSALSALRYYRYHYWKRRSALSAALSARSSSARLGALQRKWKQRALAWRKRLRAWGWASQSRRKLALGVQQTYRRIMAHHHALWNTTTRKAAAALQKAGRATLQRNAVAVDPPNNHDAPLRTTADAVPATTKLVPKPVTLTEYSQADWFCPHTGRPVTSRDATGRFVNPWQSQSTAGIKSLFHIAQWRGQRLLRLLTEWWHQQPFPQLRPPNALRLWLSKLWSCCSPMPHLASSISFSSHGTTTLPLPRNSVASSACATTTHTKQPLLVPSAVISSYASKANDVHQNKLRGNKGEPLKPNQIRLTWIGHSTCLIQYRQDDRSNHNADGTLGTDDIVLLTDPIFSPRCSPIQSLPIGVGRTVPPALSVSDLPRRIDVCLISHDHYDHLDVTSVRALRSRVQQWIVPLGIGSWLQLNCDIPVERITELEWWESVQLQKQGQAAVPTWRAVTRHSAIRSGSVTHPALCHVDEDRHSTTGNSMWVTCCPVQHWACRTLFDRNVRLWGSYAVFLPNGSKFYFGGDTALPEHFPLFDQIRDYIGGNIDLAALPIGAYEPSFYMADSHVNPSEAVRIHQALDVKQSVGIHWGTFQLSEESMEDPPVKLRAAASKANACFTTIRHGESITVDCMNH
jgi:N-acyl-phosphatidylethanolamine-hydrolysing phospholipase D